MYTFPEVVEFRRTRVLPSLSVWLNDQELETDKVYIDTDEDGNRNVSATYAYDVLSKMKGNRTSMVSLRNRILTRLCSPLIM